MSEVDVRPRLSRRTVVRRVLIGAVLMVLLWVASVPVRIWWDARQEDHRVSDAIVVLGAAQYGGRPSPVLEARLRKAQTLWQEGVAPVVVTVGGSVPGDETTEAEAGRDWLTANGLPTEAVVAVAEGNNTQSSLEAVGEVFDDEGWATAVLVTDPWHTFRSKALADAAGIDAVAAPARSGPAVQTRETQLRYIVRESLAYYRWRLTGESGQGAFDAF
ncbi:MAG TPA: YdcF family protein [Jiangellaceae bacterium]|nr:YdcF family protein [Jiangellaceae bacterium]